MSEAVLAEFELLGQAYEVRKDGRVWRTTQGLVTAEVPMKVKEIAAYCGGEEVEPTLVNIDERAIPPVRILVGWRQRLEKAAAGESVVYMARRVTWCDVTTRVPMYEWKGIVPEQTASAAHFDADELDGMYKVNEVDGWEIVGHMHVHPTGMTGRSGTDTDDWKDMPGLYVTAPRETDAFGVYASCGGCVFDVHVLRVADDVDAEEVLMIGQSGEEDWAELIKPPKARLAQWRGAGFQGRYQYQGNGRVYQNVQTGYEWMDGNNLAYSQGYDYEAGVEPDAIIEGENVDLCENCRGVLGTKTVWQDAKGIWHQYCPWCGTMQFVEEVIEEEVEEDVEVEDGVLEDGRHVLELREAEVQIADDGELVVIGWPAYDTADRKLSLLCMVDDLAEGDLEAVKTIERCAESTGL